jgi:hypothetical protein
MKVRRSELVAGVACASWAALFAAQACGGGGDGGDDATAADVTADVTADVVVTSDVVTEDVASIDATTPDGADCPTYSGTSTLCKAMVAHCEACGQTMSVCDRANFTTECEGLASAVSPAAAGAYASCASICDANAANHCQQANMADASLSSAQQKLGDDYCAVCSDAGAFCVASIALVIAEYSDTTANAIDTACVPDAATGCGGFGACASATFLGTLPNPCADAGTD